MAATATVRVSPETRARLKRLGDERKLSMPELLDALTQRAEEDQLLADHEFAMRQVMADSERGESYRAELGAWDDALLDGLAKL
jgi:predicted transcriptional regulator